MEALKLTAYIGERDRSGGRLLADALIDAYQRRGVRTSVLLRGLEGFGIKHRLQTERLLSLSEDLPILAVALDSPARIRGLVGEVARLVEHGLITLERARMLDLREPELALAELEPQDELKLTVYVGRQERAGGRRAYLAVVDCLYRHGLSGASVLLGLDGAAHGVRHRASFMAGNGEVPLMIVGVGESARIARAIPELKLILRRPSMTLERVLVCKRDGTLIAAPDPAPSPDGGGLARWQKLTVYAGERSRHGHETLHGALIRRLRAEGAPGASALRGLWGYHGEHLPHGERFWSLSRDVPVITVLLDVPESIGRWFEIVDEVTGETGLVTSEIMPALTGFGVAPTTDRRPPRC